MVFLLLFLVLTAIFLLFFGLYLSGKLFLEIKKQFNFSLVADQKASLSLNIKIFNWKGVDISLMLSAFLGPLLINAAFFLAYLCIFNKTYFNLEKLLDSDGAFDTFINTLYFTITTGTTLSYGDIVPIHWLSKSLSISQLLINLLEVSLIIYGFGKGGTWLIGKTGGGGSPSGPTTPQGSPNLNNSDNDSSNNLGSKLDKTVEEISSLREDLNRYRFKYPPYYFEHPLFEDLYYFLRSNDGNKELNDEEFSRRILDIIKKFKR